MTDPRSWYGELARAADSALRAVSADTRRPRRAFRGRRIQDRLHHQREVLRRLQEGEVQPEEALVLLLEEQAPTAPAPEFGSYLNRIGGDLRQLGTLPVLQPPGEGELDD